MAALVRFISHRVAPAAGLLAMVIVCVAAQQFAIAHEAGGHQEHTMVSPESIGYGPVNSGISSAVLSGSPSTEGSPCNATRTPQKIAM